MVESLQADSDISLDHHKQMVAGALAEANKDVAHAAKPTGGSTIGLDVAASAVNGKLGLAVTIGQTLAGQGSMFMSNNKTSTGSMFVSHGGATTGIVIVNSKASRATSLLPGKNDDLVSRSNIAGQSLTGASSTSAKTVPIIGANVTSAMTRALGVVKWLSEELATNTRLGQTPFQSAKRLSKALEQGDNAALSFVQTTPNALPQAQPKKPS